MKFRRTPLAALTLSAAALVGIAVREGYRDRAYYATPHERSAGISTIGFGTTAGVKPGDTITVERALIRLLSDAEQLQRQLKDCIGEVPLYQHEWDAYVSWAYNVGVGAACRSTLVRKLKQTPPDYAGACAELLRWTKQNGRELAGLVKRRADEYRLCMGQEK